jgi:hypothetical protein
MIHRYYMSALGCMTADITAKTDFDPNGLREHSRDLPIGLSHRPRDGNVVHSSIA